MQELWEGQSAKLCSSKICHHTVYNVHVCIVLVCLSTYIQYSMLLCVVYCLLAVTSPSTSAAYPSHVLQESVDTLLLSIGDSLGSLKKRPEVYMYVCQI